MWLLCFALVLFGRTEEKQRGCYRTYSLSQSHNFSKIDFKVPKKGENQKFFSTVSLKRSADRSLWLKVFYLVTHSGCVQVITPFIIQLHWEQITRESSKVVGQLVILNFEKTCLPIGYTCCTSLPALLFPPCKRCG